MFKAPRRGSMFNAAELRSKFNLLHGTNLQFGLQSYAKKNVIPNISDKKTQ